MQDNREEKRKIRSNKKKKVIRYKLKQQRRKQEGNIKFTWELNRR